MQQSVESNDTNSQFKKMLTEGDFIKVPKLGELVTGTVINVSRGEIHVDIGGLVTGVIRGREFYEDPRARAEIKVGDEVEATVIELENENGEMELSFRFASTQKAWDEVIALMKSGQIIMAEITDANKGGLMVKINRMPGFLPVSQLQPEHYPRVPGGDKNKILERLKTYAGQQFEVKVIDVNEQEEKLIVSEKAAWEEKQREVIASYKVGDVVEGTVTAVTDFGVFVEFGADKLEGLVHISELAWQRIDNPADVVAVSDHVSAQIIKVEGSKIFLSMKKLKDDPWKDVAKKYVVGTAVTGKVLKVTPFGLFVELDADIHGLAHISELADHAITDATTIAKPGETKTFQIISVDPANHRLGLSLKSSKSQEKKESKEEKKPAAEATEVAAETAEADSSEPAA